MSRRDLPVGRTIWKQAGFDDDVQVLCGMCILAANVTQLVMGQFISGSAYTNHIDYVQVGICVKLDFQFTKDHFEIFTVKKKLFVYQKC